MGTSSFSLREVLILFIPLFEGNIIDCKACILGGTDLELLNSAGCTAAHAAATNMHLGLLKLLNEKGKQGDVANGIRW